MKTIKISEKKYKELESLYKEFDEVYGDEDSVWDLEDLDALREIAQEFMNVVAASVNYFEKPKRIQ